MIFLVGAFWFSGKALLLVQNTVEKKVIAIDPGHGGFDGGFTPTWKINGKQWLEKDINLSISLRLKEKLKAAGYEVVMTRESDEDLTGGVSNHKKQTDMKKRVALINESGADLAISIHQNSFQEESSHGAQTFYHPSSLEGKRLAELLLEEVKAVVQDDNHRVPKENAGYYMLKNSTCPLVIVECGFLTNYEEAQKLVTEEYQEKITEGIFRGICKYFSSGT